MSDQLPANRDESGRFIPGVSGNPNGRPKASAQIRDLAREHGPAAIQRLVDIMNTSVDENVVVSACKALLDRGYGRPEQAITGKDGEPLLPSTPITNVLDASRVYAAIVGGDASIDLAGLTFTAAPANKLLPVEQAPATEELQP